MPVPLCSLTVSSICLLRFLDQVQERDPGCYEGTWEPQGTFQAHSQSCGQKSTLWGQNSKQTSLRACPLCPPSVPLPLGLALANRGAADGVRMLLSEACVRSVEGLREAGRGAGWLSGHASHLHQTFRLCT